MNNSAFSHLLQIHAHLFKKKGFTDQDYLDAVVTIVFWACLSNKGPKRNLLWIHLPHELYLDAVVNGMREEEVKQQAESFIHFLDSQFEFNTFLAGSASITNIDPDVLLLLAQSLHSYFSEDWEWSDPFIEELFLSIESFFAERLEIPHTYFTPHQVCKLISGFFPPSEQRNAYDPFCRDNSLLLSCFTGYSQRVSIMANADNNFNGKIARLKSIMAGFANDKIMVRNIYDPDLTGRSFDLILTNPPFGGKTDPDLRYTNPGIWSYKFSGISSEVDYLAHVMDHMGAEGRAAVIVPVGLLSSHGKKAWLREMLVNSCILEAIVYLPRWIFHKNGVMTAVLILDNRRLDREILMLNAAGLGTHERNRHTLSDKDLEVLRNIYNSFRQGHNPNNLGHNDIQITVTKSTIQQLGFDLQFQTYLPTQVDYATNRPKAAEVWKDLADLQSELFECKKKIDHLISKNPA
ncbi:MAG TPA: N-6 DNA methylase [Puia sp.]|jgi:hypothetical protein|nr:N-6 DNA methylase [Puia sp.]